jgi:uncharacterized OsmC-like protein
MKALERAGQPRQRVGDEECDASEPPEARTGASVAGSHRLERKDAGGAPFAPGHAARPQADDRRRYDISMNADELRALQAPLKERYREAPDAALITLRAEGRLGEGVTCKVETGRSLTVAGLHPATGGSGLAACSGDMLLEALVACAGVTLNAVATALGIELRDATLRAEGDLDFRGTLGVAKDAPVGFRSIRLRIALDTDAPQDKIDTLLRLTERYCVVYQTLAHSPTLSVERSNGTD